MFFLLNDDVDLLKKVTTARMRGLNGDHEVLEGDEMINDDDDDLVAMFPDPTKDIQNNRKGHTKTTQYNHHSILINMMANVY
jgi:hypothetical protein